MFSRSCCCAPPRRDQEPCTGVRVGADPARQFVIGKTPPLRPVASSRRRCVRAARIDADEDGKPDDASWLDGERAKGVCHELEEWRTLMPHALASGHLPRPPAERFATLEFARTCYPKVRFGLGATLQGGRNASRAAA
jgi:hypothetical protein